MTKLNLSRIKAVTTWGGVIVTAIGVGISISTSGSMKGNIIASVGICFTIIGNFVTHTLDKHAQAKQEELEARLSYAEEFMDNPAIEEVMMNYGIEHQDDGR